MVSARHLAGRVHGESAIFRMCVGQPLSILVLVACLGYGTESLLEPIMEDDLYNNILLSQGGVLCGLGLYWAMAS